MLELLFDQYKYASTIQIVLEFLAFAFGIASVYFAKKQNILVYPTGLIATIITVYLLYQAKYFGDMTMNAYFTIMSVYGWYKWRSKSNDRNIEISTTNLQEKITGIILFISTVFITYLVYKFFDYKLEIPNYIDIFTSGLFFTAMWYMALKKIENWILWIIGDSIVVPLFAYRGLGMLSLQYLIFTIIAIFGYLEWKKTAQQNKV
ncbi:nicotinamide riboside transporter PnuC [Flavobacterium sp.]|jgi:nicotinamide mononucleotide transporter|uniref:nicotinamide riboside transporter PnuC n=1 Tax=Flavobacterium sp. TaxID=239 RepID=UPI0037C0DCC3